MDKTSMALPVLAKKMKKLVSLRFTSLKIFFNLKSSNGLLKFEESYKMKAELGRGGFGVVYRAVRICDNKMVAVKFIEKKNIKEWGKINGKKVPMEICMLTKCSETEGVIRILDWYSIPEGFLIVMERPYPSIDMFDFVRAHGKLSEEITHVLFRQIVSTVYECAQNQVLHRDLKDENVVIDLATGKTKLIDFGAATEFQRRPYTNFHGTILCSPPEWLRKSLYLGEEAAVWSLGVLLYSSLNGRLPFRNETEICTAHLLGPLLYHAKVSQEVRDLIDRCLTLDPTERCTLEEIMNHSWIKKQPLSWDQLTKKNVEQESTEASKERHSSEDFHSQQVVSGC
ncbi:hypothetical protein GCK72_019551 [Caenorhabditis remanei]|uniref:Serine/threonine-protein kinase pim-1 n=1 Tax=Caenorhabditis remanei TaxID=31234 RepID=A0A6A5GE56_CAERE|nr:hypothetical protein GCK72_019551 [Caenorhabditis remanei]KAF1752996.1 hypothetical protein GCK72_019551 [Caenorhabditis remanei]